MAIQRAVSVRYVDTFTRSTLDGDTVRVVVIDGRADIRLAWMGREKVVQVEPAKAFEFLAAVDTMTSAEATTAMDAIAMTADEIVAGLMR